MSYNDEMIKFFSKTRTAIEVHNKLTRQPRTVLAEYLFIKNAFKEVLNEIKVERGL